MLNVYCVSAQVYGEYKASLAFDLVSSRQKNVSKMCLHQLVEKLVKLQLQLKCMY